MRGCAAKTKLETTKTINATRLTYNHRDDLRQTNFLTMQISFSDNYNLNSLASKPL
ncbi:hypothetical protein MBAV_002858 [Candidatus Magnetobacterium bavaricum]|uniref:Uncharacterized protein n=1 Tax=Candidatus Magnetobacterium bavaricum TaxID=29290 RepID=A0A0F3GWB0_9BACT|nr:hypothetical protein MBAV_002858 [Candidatus Magnetobacterium bavaricum]